MGFNSGFKGLIYWVFLCDVWHEHPLAGIC